MLRKQNAIAKRLCIVYSLMKAKYKVENRNVQDANFT